MCFLGIKRVVYQMQCCSPLSQMALFIVIIFLQPSMLMVECTIRHGNKQIEMSYYKRVVLVSVAFQPLVGVIAPSAIMLSTQSPW